ncbi:50S ribosome-binding GTPase [Candidatus Woesearchaeota archaeon]|nr:50S ribosome-binding GTPase [Candidatus Woesearchaeota archaeon]
MAGKKGVEKAKKREKAQLTERKKLSANERIRELEEEISKTKYNKRTQHAIGLMKAKLAMLKERALQRSSAGKARGDDRFTVRKTGDGTVVLLGFPSVGKSTLLNKLTKAKSDVGTYAFTTLSAVPGMMEYKFAKIQIIDVPGIVSGAASGRGRGKEVLGIIRNADLIMILVDAIYPEHYNAILKEIYETGVRINQKKPDVRITKKPRGGIGIGATIKLTKIDKKTVTEIAREMKIANADILIRTDINADELIDIIEGNKKYTKALTIITKIDLVDETKLNEIKKKIKPDVVVSAEKEIGIEELREKIYERMGFIRIFLKEVNKPADMEEPLIMFKGCTIKDVCEKLHRDFVDKFKFARVWGKSAKFDGQIFHKMDKELIDKDILELHIK